MMIHIVTDSSADIPEDWLQRYKIHVVPLSVRVNGKEYIEGINITAQQFYQEMFAADELPKTSQPTPAQFAEVFQALSGQGIVICLTISSKLSGSFSSANLGKESSGNEDVLVFDTLSGSLGHGIMVLKAAEMAETGASADQIMEQLKKMRERTKLLILLDTLENIVKGGRLNRVQGSLAKLLNIKVILHNVDGHVEILEKIRGRNKFLQRAVELVGEYGEDFSQRMIGITHVNNLADARILAAEIEAHYHPQKILISEMGASTATYAGKDGLIVAL